MDSRKPRDGRVIEELGWYDPVAPEDRQLSIKVDRADYWLSVGAQPSETVAALFKKNGIDPKPGPHHAELVDSDKPVSMESAAE